MKDGRLQASDLMAGDLVDVRCDAAPNTPHIERITPAHFLRDEIWLPIPLTKEILEKIGFVYNQGKYGNSYTLGAFFLLEPTVIAPEMMDEYKGAYLLHIGNDWIVIKYIHELQHALKLCKIEKTIEL